MECLLTAARASRDAPCRTLSECRSKTSYIAPPMSFDFAALLCNDLFAIVFRTLRGIGSRSLSINFSQQVGMTRSLKAIRQPLDINETVLAEMTRDYGPDDHFDAYALFQFLLARELASIGKDSQRIGIYELASNFYLKNLPDEELERQKEILSIATIFDIINFGNSCSHGVLQHQRQTRIK